MCTWQDVVCEEYINSIILNEKKQNKKKIRGESAFTVGSVVTKATWNNLAFKMNVLDILNSSRSMSQ